MKLYRNYDDKSNAFGDISISATALGLNNVLAFAALLDDDNAMTVIVINKQLHRTAQTTLDITQHPQQGTVERWQLHNNLLTRLSDQTILMVNLT